MNCSCVKNDGCKPPEHPSMMKKSSGTTLALKRCERYGTGENDNLSIRKSIDKYIIWSQKHKEPCEFE